MTAEGYSKTSRPRFALGATISLVVELDESCGPHLMVTALSSESEVMALAHRQHQTYGVQFRPESILTEQGHVLLLTFLRLTETPCA